MSNKQERVEIYIQEDMDTLQRSLLVAKLEHERGIIGAWFEGAIIIASLSTMNVTISVTLRC